LYRDGDQGIDPHTAHNAGVDPKEVFGLPHRFIKNPSWFNGTPQSWLAEKSDTFDTAFVRGSYSLEALRNKIYVAKGDATGWPAAGGRTSDAAAVRGDAGPDRAVTDTHGIDRRWPAQAAESVYKGLGKEKCCKSGGISGNFGGTGADLRPLGALRMKTVSQCREQAGWGKIGTVFEVKKEIPVKMRSHKERS
jgi:hypothetical protein